MLLRWGDGVCEYLNRKAGYSEQGVCCVLSWGVGVPA